jgi:hypothetical protein
MPRVTFAPNLARQTAAPESIVDGDTVASALSAVFALHPALRGYVLDDQGTLRKHVAVFVDGACIADRQRLTDSLSANSEIYVVQSLSGG